ncbi:MAG: TetR/AcrR family transcriptional regulator [Promethearchaeota archaeon]
MITHQMERLNKIKKEKRDLYLFSAISVFEERGFNNTRIKDITIRAGTSVGNFYQYFNSKEEILEVIIKQFYELMLNKLKVLNKYEIPPVSAIKKLYEDYIKMFKEKKEISLIFLEQISGISNEFNEKKREYLDNLAKEIEKLISRLADKNLIRKQNPEITARAYIGTIAYTLHWWIRSDFKIDEKELIANLIDFLIRGTVHK